jgi:ubiquinone/menaquinone biosynthesis C-methylase UbiE
VQSSKLLMLRFLPLLAALALAFAPGGPARPQENPACEQFAWPLDRERALFKAEALKTVPSGAVLDSLERGVALQLLPNGAVTFALPPGRAPKAQDSYGGIVVMENLPKGGVWQVTASAEAWIDVIQDGKSAASIAHTGKRDCEDIRKSVQFELQPGRVTLQISGASVKSIKLAVLPVAHEHMSGHSDGAFHRRFDDAEKWAKEFDNPERDAWQKPEEVVDALKLAPGSVVADIGAGTGYFSVRIAKRIPGGKVFAADVEPDMVRYLGERAQREHLANLIPVQAAADAANLPEPADLIIIADTYHHIGNRTDYFAKLRSSLRPDGRLAIVDSKADSPNGPPVEHRISPERVTEELQAAGYALAETHEFLPRQYFLVFRKQGS